MLVLEDVEGTELPRCAPLPSREGVPRWHGARVAAILFLLLAAAFVPPAVSPDAAPPWPREAAGGKNAAALIFDLECGARRRGAHTSRHVIATVCLCECACISKRFSRLVYMPCLCTYMRMYATTCMHIVHSVTYEPCSLTHTFLPFPGDLCVHCVLLSLGIFSRPHARTRHALPLSRPRLSLPPLPVLALTSQSRSLSRSFSLARTLALAR